MKTIIRKYKFDWIWHFTDKSNLQLIKAYGGLLSLREAERRGVVIPAPGGNDWSHSADRRKGVDEYVHLAFVDDHPMLYRAKQEGRILHPIWLKVSAAVLIDPNVRFSADVANKAGVPILDAEDAKCEIDFDVLFTYMDWHNPEVQERRRAALKSEILIPDVVPIDRIAGFKNG